MKSFLYSSLIILSATIASPAIAADVTPHELVFQGYQGRLKSKGVAGYATFRQAVFLGRVDAETLVKGAVAQGKLDPGKANDQSYLNEVKSYLSLLRVSGSGR